MNQEENRPTMLNAEQVAQRLTLLMGNQGGKAILGLSRPFQFWEKKGPKMNECGQTLLGIGHLVHPSSGAAGNGQGRASAHSFQP